MTTGGLTSRDEDPGQHAIEFIERRLVHIEGKWAGSPFLLPEWQREGIVRPLFGRLREDGTRQYRSAFIALPRKNGKSTLGAALALKLLFADGEYGAQIFSAAGDKEQARIIFGMAWRMIEMSPALEKRARKFRTGTIEVKNTGSIYRALSAEAYTKHGLNAHGILFDELHTQPNRELWDVLTTSMGTRRQPLRVAITTADFDRPSICNEEWDYAERVASGVLQDEACFVFMRSAPKGADWRDERVWHAVNPGLGEFRSLDEMRAAARKADQVPALQNTFRRLYLNQRTSQDSRWLDLAKWDATAGLVVAEKLKGRQCYAGLDLASTTDIAALVLLFPMDDGTFETLQYFWIPGENVREKGNRDRAPYEDWVAGGLMTATEGNVIDYATIRERIKSLGLVYDIREIAFDRWGATQLSQDLMADGFTMVPTGQGFASMSPPTKELLNLVLAKRLRHGGNAVLRWMADNMAVAQDAAGNLKPNKAKATGRIDGMVALIMAVDRATRHAASVYEERGVMSV